MTERGERPAASEMRERGQAQLGRAPVGVHVGVGAGVLRGIDQHLAGEAGATQHERQIRGGALGGLPIGGDVEDAGATESELARDECGRRPALPEA